MRNRRLNWEPGKLGFEVETSLIFFQKMSFVGNGLDRAGENCIIKGTVG